MLKEKLGRTGIRQLFVTRADSMERPIGAIGTTNVVSPGDRLRAEVFGSWNNSPARNVYWVAEFKDLGGSAQWHGWSPLKTISGSGSDTNNCPDKYATGSNSGHVQDTGNFGDTRIRTYLLDADTGEILGEAVTSEYLITVSPVASYSTQFNRWVQLP